MVPPDIAEGAGAYPAPSVDTPMFVIYNSLFKFKFIYTKCMFIVYTIVLNVYTQFILCINFTNLKLVPKY